LVREKRVEILNSFLAIDPGTLSLGYAFFKNKYPHEFDLLQEKSTRNWIFRTKHLVNNLDELYFNLRPKKIIIELPEFWGGIIGQSARDSGSIFKLSFLVGAIYDRLSQYCPVITVTPSKWKGQLKKEMVRSRLRLKYPKLSRVIKELDHNVMDAIGIGSYYANKT